MTRPRRVGPATVVFVLVDGEFDPALAATLPGGLDGLMYGGPRD